MNHTTEETLDELQTMVDYGGTVLDVFVEHPLYGQIRADLMVHNRLEVSPVCGENGSLQSTSPEYADGRLALSYGGSTVRETPGSAGRRTS